MQKLNPAAYDFKINKLEQSSEIFDVIRKKYVALTPEEWVRQHFIKFLTTEKGYPSSLISVEMALKYNGMKRRSDVVVFGRDAKPLLLVECKAPEVKISPAVFEQIARYNMTFKVKYLIVTNGVNSYCSIINFEEQSYRFMENIPTYNELI